METINKTTSIVICGVGGQGIILASTILGEVCCLSDYDVKKAEVHGMAQRGGSVISHLRFGKKVYSPLCPKGEVDIILSFEQLEALRYADMLAESGKMIVNKQKILPLPVAIGLAKYPENIIEKLRELLNENLFVIPADEIAKTLGNMKVVNLIMLGALSKLLPFPRNIWEEAIKKNVPAKYLELNLKAFDLGKKSMETQ